MGGEAVAQGMYRGVFGNSCIPQRGPEGGLDGGVADMMPPDPAAARVDGERGRGKYILPGPLLSRIRVLAGERVGKIDDAPSCGDISFLGPVSVPADASETRGGPLPT